MEKRNIIETVDTNELNKQANMDTFDKDAVSVFTGNYQVVNTFNVDKEKDDE